MSKICGKVQLERSPIFHVREVEKFNWKEQLHFMCTGWKSLTGEAYNISSPRSGKNNLENSAIFHVHEVEKFTRRTIG